MARLLEWNRTLVKAGQPDSSGLAPEKQDDGTCPNLDNS